MQNDNKTFYLLDASLDVSHDVDWFNYTITDTQVISNIDIAMPPNFHNRTFASTLENETPQLPVQALSKQWTRFRLHSPHAYRLIYQEERVWIAGEYRKMTISESHEHTENQTCEWLLIQVAGLDDCWLNLNGRTAFFEKITMSQRALLEYFLGPIYINLITRLDRFCFHASALLDHYDNKAVLFVAESGTGKSTLAESLNHSMIKSHSQQNSKPKNGVYYSRISDDITPTQVVSCNNQTKVFALPRYPQPKLSDEAQYNGKEDAFKIKAIIKLHPYPIGHKASQESIEDNTLTNSTLRNNVRLDALSIQEAFLLTIRHGVATRGFNQTVLAQHFDYCKKIADSVAMYTLSYPRELTVYPSIKRLLDTLR